MLGSRRNGIVGGSGGREVCPFYLQGRCKFGENCKNEHPRDHAPRDTNPFAPLQNGGSNTGGRGRAGALGGGGDRYRPAQSSTWPYYLSADGIKADLASGPDGERPSWPLSAYGPGRDAPRQLLEGAIEQSPEELRVQYYIAKATGSTEQYEQGERNAVAHAEQQMANIAHDVDGALNYVVSGKDVHPNREDMVVKPRGAFREAVSGGSGFAQPSAFGTASSAVPSGGPMFGQPSALGAAGGSTSSVTSEFGQPSAFGVQQPSAFGQPSTLGGSSAFGKPSQIGSGASAFSQPAQVGGSGGGTAFGQSSAFGQKASPFGQPSPPQFGQSSFGQASKPTFGIPSQPSSGFGQPSTLGSTQAFSQSSGSTGFAATAKQSSPFAQVATSQEQTPFNHLGASSGFSAFGSHAGSNPFAAQAAGNSAFGQPPHPSSTGFGQPSQPSNSAFGKPSQPGTSVLGQPSGGSSAQPSVFGGGAQANGTAIATPTGFGSTTAPAPQAPLQPNDTGATNGGPDPAAYIIRNPNGTLRTFKGYLVNYNEEQHPMYQKSSTGKPERIWMPDGPPTLPNPDVEASPDIYVGDLGAMLKEVYDYVLTNGEFKDGIMPEIPPKREWVRWDL